MFNKAEYNCQKNKSIKYELHTLFYVRLVTKKWQVIYKTY